jgi:hypothetical protein
MLTSDSLIDPAFTLGSFANVHQHTRRRRMKSKILILGFACLSVAAVAQSDAKKKEDPAPTTVVSPRDAMSGQASGKRMHKPMTIQKEYGAREASTGKATGKTMAQDDWQAPSVAPESKPKATRVAAGDLNGDGKADVASPNSAQATGQNAAVNGRSDVKSPRDISTGQASGKRQHQDITITKYSDKAPAPKK